MPESTSPRPPTQNFGDVENIEAKTGFKTERLGELDGVGDGAPLIHPKLPCKENEIRFIIKA